MATIAATQSVNPVYRHNRAFYTSMWTTNPPEYTTQGQVVPAGTMHWRVFHDQGNQRREARAITGIGTWWQPSDLAGSFPQTIHTPEFRIYPTTSDSGNLVVPDLSQPPQATVAPTPMTVTAGNAFNSVTISLSQPLMVQTPGDFAICGVYPAGASSSLPGYFGYLPSAANESYGLAQSYYGFAYANGTITHFGLGGARSSIFYTENQATLAVRAAWAVSSGHFQNGHIGTAWGDAAYFSPLADANWPGWSDSRNPTTFVLDVFAEGRDGDLPLLLLNFGPRFPFGYALLGQTLEIAPNDPVLGLLVPFGAPIVNGRFSLELPLGTAAIASARGTYFGFEAVLVDAFNGQLSGSTPSVWIRN